MGNNTFNLIWNGFLCRNINSGHALVSRETSLDWVIWAWLDHTMRRCFRRFFDSCNSSISLCNRFCNVARIKAENVLLPVYRKELRKVLSEYLRWMPSIKTNKRIRISYTHKPQLYVYLFLVPFGTDYLRWCFQFMYKNKNTFSKL